MCNTVNSPPRHLPGLCSSQRLKSAPGMLPKKTPGGPRCSLPVCAAVSVARLPFIANGLPHPTPFSTLPLLNRQEGVPESIAALSAAGIKVCAVCCVRGLLMRMVVVLVLSSQGVILRGLDR